jgi:hypothetical protein
MLSSSPAVVRADGVDWPLATFLDAYGFHLVDRFVRPRIGGEHRVLTIDNGGQVQPARYADVVDWHAVYAWRAADPVSGPEACFNCGTSADEEQVCGSCEADAEPWL